jgi:hypothetical protein
MNQEIAKGNQRRDIQPTKYRRTVSHPERILPYAIDFDPEGIVDFRIAAVFIGKPTQTRRKPNLGNQQQTG